MTAARPRLTVDGSERLEGSLWTLLDEAAARVTESLPARALRALVLIGGYGRGEGGVLLEAGVERPHNNLDLLAILDDMPAGVPVQAILDQALEPLRVQSGIGLDAGVTTAARLRRSPCLVMWVDMRNGHRLLAGDEAFVPSLARFTVERLVPDDVRDLLVNRAALFAINDEIVARQGAAADPRVLLKHAVKAIIGYGDALLFFHGRYDSSYCEKGRRMAQLNAASPEFRRLYQDAIAFRLRPDYARGLSAEGSDPQRLRPILREVHAECERRRLGRAVDWNRQAVASLRGELRPATLSSLMDVLRRGRTALRFRPPGAGPADLRAHLGLRWGGARALLAATLPAVVYPSTSASLEQAARLLNAGEPSLPAVREAFLRLWGRWGDSNFGHVAKKTGIAPTSIPLERTSPC